MLSPAARSYTDYMQRFLTAHGNPNYGHSGIWGAQMGFSFSYTIGEMPFCDYDSSEVILVWARQPFFSGPALSVPKNFLRTKKI